MICFAIVGKSYAIVKFIPTGKSIASKLLLTWHLRLQKAQMINPLNGVGITRRTTEENMAIFTMSIIRQNGANCLC
ncbi:hypothetical protein [Thalassotalea aquiviva]|uniref:hypothetical protein n=1 Tax=Thalassotalea aquiviva TaxID=3242415 RepID=UPI00352AF1AA